MKNQSENIAKFELLKERYVKAFKLLYNRELKHIQYINGYIYTGDNKIRLSKFEQMTNTLESRIVDFNSKKVTIEKKPSKSFHELISRAKYELLINKIGGKNRYNIIDSVTGVSIAETLETYNINPEDKAKAFANFFIDALHYYYLTGKSPSDLLIELKTEADNKRKAALLWFRKLEINPMLPKNQNYYFELYKSTNFTIANIPSQLTGREIEAIYELHCKNATESGSNAKII